MIIEVIAAALITAFALLITFVADTSGMLKSIRKKRFFDYLAESIIIAFSSKDMRLIPRTSYLFLAIVSMVFFLFLIANAWQFGKS